MSSYAYLDPDLSIEERTSDLLGRMTLPEKVGQMLQLDARQDLVDIVTVRMAGSILHASPTRMTEALALVQQTRMRSFCLLGGPGSPPRRPGCRPTAPTVASRVCVGRRWRCSPVSARSTTPGSNAPTVTGA